MLSYLINYKYFYRFCRRNFAGGCLMALILELTLSVTFLFSTTKKSTKIHRFLLYLIK